MFVGRRERPPILRLRLRALDWLFICASALAGGWIVLVTVANALDDPRVFGYDFRFYRDVGARWLADGLLYLPHQLAGPYDFAMMVDVVYPPNASTYSSPRPSCRPSFGGSFRPRSCCS
jgi:hypothetical protein